MSGDITSSTHPPLPSTTEDDRFSRLRLLRSRRVGIATFWRLLETHGSARAALAALPEIAREAGVDSYRVCPEGVVRAEMQAGAAAGARLVCHGDCDYPAALAEIEDAPPLLWMIGEAALARRPMVALVGARNASSLGLRMARALARGLGSAGYTVVSGLARGIDAAAHEAALETGTIAVHGGGVDVLYPAENAALAGRIVGIGGLRISEQPIGLQPMARHFPMRNRIVSGLCRATIVVEAAVKSGSLITARTALDQGREVMAVPGHPFDARAGGCNLLLRDGARMVRSADDVIEALETLPEPGDAGMARGPASGREGAQHAIRVPSATPEPPPADPADLHQVILARLGAAPVSEDALVRDLGAPIRVVSPALTDLELNGHIRREAGGLLSLRAGGGA